MPKSSRYQLILDTIIAELAKDTSLKVERVFTKETTISTEKATIYVNVINDDLNTLTTENRYNPGYRNCKVGIYGVIKNPLDGGNVGTASIAHGVLVEKIDRRIENIAAALPIADTTTAGFTITMHGIQAGGVTGFVDDKSDKVAILYECNVKYLQQ